MPASTILLLESTTTGDATLATILTSAGYTVTRTTDVAEAVSKVPEHQLAAIDVGAGIKGKTAFEMCHDIRAAASTCVRLIPASMSIFMSRPICAP